MNKFTKASVAGAVGIALLLGGAGSFALWNDSATVDAGSINAGSLALSAQTDGAWKNITPGHVGAIDSSFRMVPGDTVQYTQSLTITGVGDDLSATLTPDFVAPLANGFTSTFEVVKVSGPINVANNTVTLKKAGSATVQVRVTLAFDVNAIDGEAAELKFDGMLFNLEQVAP
jgi:alternate signal-mediated exported protein